MISDKARDNIRKGKYWVKKSKTIVQSPDFEIFHGYYNEMKDFKMDPAGFVLIKIYPSEQEIGLALVDNDTFELEYEIRGKKCQDIYHYLFNVLDVELYCDHAAYIGKELKKAEIALHMNLDYEQE